MQPARIKLHAKEHTNNPVQRLKIRSLELGAIYSITTFIRDIRTLFQIRQVARLRSTTCNLQGLSSTQRSTQTTPSRDLTLGGKERNMQLATVRSPKPAGRHHVPQAREPLQTIFPAVPVLSPAREDS
jgi:hypothetical protein